MARVFVFLVLGIIATALQGMLLYVGLPSYVLPQMGALLVVFLSFNEVSVIGAFLAFGLGLILDFSSALLIGPWAGAFVAVYGCLAVLSQRLFIESGVVAVVTSFVAVFVANILYMILAYEFRSSGWGDPVQALGQAGATALLAPLLLGYLSKRLRKKSTSPLGRSGALSVG